MLINFGKITNKLKNTFLSVILLLFIILCFDLPLANWASFITILVTLYAICLGKISNHKFYWVYALVIILGLIIIKHFIYLPKIEVGEQIYSPNDQYLNKVLPISIANKLKNDWSSLNQPFTSHPANASFTANPWAYSSDSFFDKPKMSRIINLLNFKDRYDFRVGVLNNAKYNHFSNNLGSTGAYYPLIFSFLIPKSMSSKNICWTGKIFLQKNNEWEEFFTKNKKCINLNANYWKSKNYLPIYASDFDEKNPLSISIKNNIYTFVYFLSIFSAGIILILLTRLNRSDFSLIFLSIVCILLYMADQHYRGGHPSSFSGLPYMGRGNDGLTHYSYAREMMLALYNNNIFEWFRGNEDIFYMMPGLRYLYGITMPFFGESIFGLLIIISLTPIAIRSILQKIFNKKWQIIMLSCFFIIPLFEAFGFYQIYLAKYTIEGFGAGIAISALIAAFSFLWKKEENIYSNTDLLKASFCLALAISLRPNFLPTAAVILIGLTLYFLTTKNIYKIIPLSIGFSPILLLTYHNFLFGNKFVPITNSATIGNNMKNSPEYWYNCLSSLSNSCNYVINHISIWISYTEPWYIIVLACLFYILFNKSISIRNKLFAFSLIFGHLVFLFYEGVPRYSHGIWLISFILCLPIFKNGIINIYKTKFIEKF